MVKEKVIKEVDSFQEQEILRQPTPEQCDNCERINEFTKSKSDLSEFADDLVSVPSETEKGTNQMFTN